MYQLEVKATLVEQRFPVAGGWSVTVDVDAMELARGGTHPADKLLRVEAAYERLRRLGATLGTRHPTYGRADIVAEHATLGTVIVEVEGSAARQREQAMYAAIGQLLVSMKHDHDRVTYAIAVPDTQLWRHQLAKIPLVVLAKLKLRLFCVGPCAVADYPDEVDISERIELDGELAEMVAQLDAVDGGIDELLSSILEPPAPSVRKKRSRSS